MPVWRYRTEDVPAKAVAAVSPLPSTNTIASSWGLVHTVGSPGTLQIPSPKPQSIPPGPLNRQAQPSYNSPDIFLPSIYVTAPTPQLVPHTIDNEIPVPAISSSQPYAPYSATAVTKTPANPSVAQRAWHIGGRRVTAWPRVSPVWPVFGGSQNG